MASAVKRAGSGGRKGTVSQLRKQPRTSGGRDLLNGVYPAEVNWQAVAEMGQLARESGCHTFVYFVAEEGEEGAVKIGTAVNPIKRRRELQTGNPRSLRVERLLIGDRDLESHLQTAFREHVIGSARPRSRLARQAYPAATEWFSAEGRKSILGWASMMSDMQLSKFAHGEAANLTDFSRAAMDVIIKLSANLRMDEAPDRFLIPSWRFRA